MVTFWTKLLNGRNDKLSYSIYQILPKESKWLKAIESILNSTGMSYIWDMQAININHIW